MQMKKKSVLILSLMILFSFLGSVSVQGSIDNFHEIGETIDILLEDERLFGAFAGVTIRDGETGEILYDHYGDKRLTPASVQKCLISAAALEVLGPDYTFETSLYTDGEIVGGTLLGNLYLKGTGDATMNEERYEKLAQNLKDMGIRIIQGNLILDDTYFDDERLAMDLSYGNQNSRSGAQISALNLTPDEWFNDGTVRVYVHPTVEGYKARIEINPENTYLNIINNVKTVPSYGNRSVSMNRIHGTNDVILEGTMPVGATRWFNWLAVWEPTGLVGNVFARILADKGIELVYDDIIISSTPEYANLLTSTESIPLHEINQTFMGLSRNSIAEIYVKAMGREVYGEGSWPKGHQVVEEFLSDLGMDVSLIRIRDGSGMSHLNMISTNSVTELLYLTQEKDWFPLYLDSFPLAGVSEVLEGGTLRNRMTNTAAAGTVYGKTGSLTSKISLAGWVKPQDSEESLIYAIILNNYMSAPPRDIIDAIAILLATYMTSE